MEALATRLGGLPRLARIILCAVIAVLSAALFSQLATLAVGAPALRDRQAATLIFALSAVVGLATYIIGWWGLLGFDDEAEPHLGRRAVYFVFFGVLVGLALLVWLLISVVIAALPPQIPI